MINKKSQAWFFLEQTVSTGSIVTLPEEEARHAAGARRLEQGSSLTLFNGDGLVSDASVISLSRATLGCVVVVVAEDDVGVGLIGWRGGGVPWASGAPSTTEGSVKKRLPTSPSVTNATTEMIRLLTFKPLA